MNQRLLLLLFITLVSVACTPSKLNYKISPELSQLASLKQNVNLIAIAVNDLRQPLSSGTEDEYFVSGDKDDAAQLKLKIINALKANGYKIITDPLLADLSLTFEIEKLSLKVKESLFKAKLEAISEINLKAQNKGNRIEKRYKTSRGQEVAIPVNGNDTTGLLNQALSAQLNTIFADQQLISLANKPAEDATETFTIDPVN